MEESRISAENRPACIEADVVVVGEGFAGLSTALSAAEQGLGVVIVTASKKPVGRGGAVFASYSKVMQAQGLSKQEVERFYLDEFAAQSYAVDQRKWYRFYNRSEEAMNWIIDHLEGSGINVVLEQGNTDFPGSPSDQPLGTHGFMVHGSRLAGSGIGFALKHMEEKFVGLGGRVFHSCIASELVRGNGGKGRVCAVIAKDGNGAEKRFSARRRCPVHRRLFRRSGDDAEVLSGLCALFRRRKHGLRCGHGHERPLPRRGP